MKKKSVCISLMLAAALICSAFFAACGSGGNGGESGGGNNEEKEPDKPIQHTHTLIAVQEEPATCKSTGNKKYYVCDGNGGCGKWYWDESGTNEIVDRSTVVLSLTDHRYENGICSVCGIKKPTEGLSFLPIEENQTVVAYSVSKGTATETEIVIPSEYDGKPVAEIGENAFYEYELTSVEIPASIKVIEKNAFRSCLNLTEVVIPDSVIKISYGAFYGCKGLKEITIGKSVAVIEQYAFEGMGTGAKNVYYTGDLGGWCEIDFGESGDSYLMNKGRTLYVDGKKVEGDIVIPKGTTKISDRAFYRQNITSVTISDGVTSIGKDAFYSCPNLKNVTIPDSVTIIDKFAFLSCTGLLRVEIGIGVKEFGSQAFQGCTYLSEIRYGGTLAQWGAIVKGQDWDYKMASKTDTEKYKIICSDGSLEDDGSMKF